MKRALFLVQLLFIFCFSSKAQNALIFDGNNDEVNCGSDTAVSFGDKAITVEAWVYATAWKTNIYNGTIVLKEDNNTNVNSGWMLRAGNGGRLGFGMGPGGGGSWSEVNTSSAVLSLNTWHHVAATYDGAMMRLYVDGNYIDSAASTISIGVNSVPVTIGYHPAYGDRYWQGKIDEVRLWKRVLSQSEIQAGMNDEFCGPQYRLQAYYKFDRGIPNSNNTGLNTALDYSGRNNTASLSGFSLTGTTSNWTRGANLSQDASYAYDTIKTCSPFYDPVANVFYNTSGIYTDTTISFWGCDSVIVKDITINSNTRDTIVAAVCDSFISPKGIIYRKSGTYYNILKNRFDCDSVITIYLKVGADTTHISELVCEQYTVPSGNRTYYQTGIYYDTLVSYLSCDSIIEIDLTVLGPTTGTEQLNMCDSVISPSGTEWYYSEGTYEDVVMNSLGCDSLIEVDVIDVKTFESLAPQTCYEYASPSGKVWTQSGVYLDTVYNSQCYTVYEVDLDIIEATEENIELNGCRQVESPVSGAIWTESGMYYDTIANAAGCDSLITMDVTVTHVNVDVQTNTRELTALSTSGSYQWLDCEDSYAEIAGADQQVYTSDNSGIFAVEVEENFCLDTSECFTIKGASIQNLEASKAWVSPNPSSSEFEIEYLFNSGSVQVEVYDLTGKQIYSKQYMSGDIIHIRHNWTPGSYYISIINNNERYSQLLIIQ
ncbi:T9SS type A sorting domain-containing protein [bacterium]|nr:T9SS type A sorting domain-containing protein [bacterium]